MDNKKPTRETKAKRQAKVFHVYIEQVNATYVAVDATDEAEARIKGYRKWRKEDAHSRITWVRSL